MECKICGKEFELKKENMYLVKNSTISMLFNNNEYEAFDCPYCGCQNIVNERFLKVEVNVDENILNE